MPLATAALPPSSFTVDVFLTHTNPAGLRSTFLAVSDPTSPRFGKHLSAQQLCAFTKPRDSAGRVAAHLVAHGLKVAKASRCGDVLSVTGSKLQLQRAFNMTIAHFQSTTRRDVTVWAAPSGLHLPPQLSSLVRIVNGLHFPVIVRDAKQKKPVAVASAKYAVATPAILKKLYSVSVQVANASASPASQGVAGWEHQSYSEGE